MRGSNERRNVRRRVCYGAQIMLEAASAPIEALVRNISDKGAAVRAPDGRPLPSSFQLSVDRSGVTRAVKVIWKRGRDFGVSFDSPTARDNVIDAQSWIGEMRRTLSAAH